MIDLRYRPASHPPPSRARATRAVVLALLGAALLSLLTACLGGDATPTSPPPPPAPPPNVGSTPAETASAVGGTPSAPVAPEAPTLAPVTPPGQGAPATVTAAPADVATPPPSLPTTTPLPPLEVPPTRTPLPIPSVAVPPTATALPVLTIAPPPATATAPAAPPPALATPTSAAALPTVPPVAPSTPPPPGNQPPTVAPPAVPTLAPPPPSPAPDTPTPIAKAGIAVLAAGFGAPDDVAVDPRDGTIYFGDFGNSAINRLPPQGGKPVPVATGIQEPEGIVVLPDGGLIVAEQKTNRILAVNPATGAKRMVRQVVNTTGQDGMDGLGYDPRDGTILVPDSPNGRLYRMPVDGSRLTLIASGFTRPTDAEVLPDGTILVADEFGNALVRLTADGRHHTLATMYQPDDVAIDAQGIAYVNALGGAIYRVDPATGRRTTLLSGLQLPHGLAVDPQGALIIAEATRNRIFRLVP